MLDVAQVKHAISKLDFDAYDQILVANPVGKFKFEPGRTIYSETDIDPKIWASNVLTARNLFSAVLTQRKQQAVTCMIVGSIAQDYQVPAYSSYIASRFIVEAETQQLLQQEKVGILSLRVSTVDIYSEHNLRPFADSSYWLNPLDFAREAAHLLLHTPSGRYIEHDLFAYMPGFDAVSQFMNDAEILARWRRDMGEEAYRRYFP